MLFAFLRMLRTLVNEMHIRVYLSCHVIIAMSIANLPIKLNKNKNDVYDKKEIAPYYKIRIIINKLFILYCR